MRKAFISEEICNQALQKMVKLMDSKATGNNPAATQLQAAKAIVQACQTQERYNLRPLTEGEMEFHRSLDDSRVTKLEEMTTEELLALQADLESTKFP